MYRHANKKSTLDNGKSYKDGLNRFRERRYSSSSIECGPCSGTGFYASRWGSSWRLFEWLFEHHLEWSDDHYQRHFDSGSDVHVNNG